LHPQLSHHMNRLLKMFACLLCPEVMTV
jgi:hypothetical protein